MPQHNTSYQIRLGDLDPHGEHTGVTKRLKNLGYLEDDRDEAAVPEALAFYRHREALPAGVGIDETLLKELEQQHRGGK